MSEKPRRGAGDDFAPPKAEFDFDVEKTTSSLVGLEATIPGEAFTAAALGVHRAGSGVVIGDGLILTIGYLITEAEDVRIVRADGRAVAGHPLAVDSETGFGLVQALEPLELPPLELGRSSLAQIGDPVVVCAGVAPRAMPARVFRKQPFAGYWEYRLTEAFFTTPVHPLWAGTAVVDREGRLIAIGSLAVESQGGGGPKGFNISVPIDLLPPILDDMLKTGRRRGPVRPWLGVYCHEVDGRVVIADVATGGPADAAGLESGDIVVSVRDSAVEDLGDFYGKVWACGDAGVEIPLEIVRDGREMWVRIKSVDRMKLLKKPRLH